MVEKSHTAAGPGTSWWPSVYEPLRGIGQKVADWFAPAADAAATDNYYEINMELPGVAADGVEVSLHENTLTIKGEKHHEHEEAGRSYYFSERAYGAFQRSFRIPADAQADSITADFKDGVLTVKVPKSEPAEETTQRIEVRTG
jgi:HSP20 family protein